jgi:hypothetical protein
MTANNSAALTDAQVLASLVQRYADGLSLPSHVIGRDGSETPLLDWLHALRYDRADFSTYVASRLDHPAERPTVSEIALTLRARLAEPQS